MPMLFCPHCGLRTKLPWKLVAHVKRHVHGHHVHAGSKRRRG